MLEPLNYTACLKTILDQFWFVDKETFEGFEHLQNYDKRLDIEQHSSILIKSLLLFFNKSEKILWIKKQNILFQIDCK